MEPSRSPVRGNLSLGEAFAGSPVAVRRWRLWRSGRPAPPIQRWPSRPTPRGPAKRLAGALPPPALAGLHVRVGVALPRGPHRRPSASVVRRPRAFRRLPARAGLPTRAAGPPTGPRARIEPDRSLSATSVADGRELGRAAELGAASTAQLALAGKPRSDQRRPAEQERARRPAPASIANRLLDEQERQAATQIGGLPLEHEHLADEAAALLPECLLHPFVFVR